MCQTNKIPTQGTSGRDTPVTRVTRISCAKYILCWVGVAKFRLWTPGVYIYIIIYYKLHKSIDPQTKSAAADLFVLSQNGYRM